MIIYADEIFVQNFAAAYIMLTVYAKIFHKKSPPLRMISGSAAAASVGVIGVVCGINLTMPGSVAAYILSFGIKTRNLLQNIVVFSVYEIILTAVSYMICSLLGARIIYSTAACFNLGAKRIILSLCTAYPITAAVMRLFCKNRRKSFCRVKITKNKNTAEATAILDTGNTLVEPRTGRSVIVVDKAVARKLLPGEKIKQPSDLEFIPYKTISSSGVMPVFPADSVTVDDSPAERFYIGISPVKLSDGNEYNALIGG